MYPSQDLVNAEEAVLVLLHRDEISHREEYEKARKLWNGCIDLHPKVIAQCRSEQDVITALRYAKIHQLEEISIRGGGHNVCGFASCSDGIMIDMSKMNGVKFNDGGDGDENLVRVQAGALWSDVDRECAKRNRYVVGGMVSHTGVAGLTLGGGIGWLSRAYGLTCDNLVSVRMVSVEDESIVEIKENDELMFGLRGGGGNFGICTEFTFKTRKLTKMDHGIFVYPFDNAEKVVETYFEMTNPLSETCPKIPDNITLYLFIAKEQIIIMSLFHEGDVTANEKESSYNFYVDNIVGKLFEMGPLLTSFCDDYVELQQKFDIGNRHGKKYYWKTLFFNEPITKQAITHLLKCIQTSPEATNIEVMHLGGEISRKSKKDTAYVQRDAIYEIHSIGSWEDDTDISVFKNWADSQFYSGLCNFSCNVSGYVNTSGAVDCDTVEYYKENYERLVQLKRKYDPNNLLKRNHNIKP